MAFSCFIKSVIAKSANREMKDADLWLMNNPGPVANIHKLQGRNYLRAQLTA